MRTVYNFSSGSAILPELVLAVALEEMLSWHGRGYSIMETSDRSPEFVAIMEQTEAQQHGLVQLKGHRLVGGMRASIYNAMPLAGVSAVVDFMQEFEKRHG